MRLSSNHANKSGILVWISKTRTFKFVDSTYLRKWISWHVPVMLLTCVITEQPSLVMTGLCTRRRGQLGGEGRTSILYLFGGRVLLYILASLQLIRLTRLASNFHQSSILCLLGVGITGRHYHSTSSEPLFLNETMAWDINTRKEEGIILVRMSIAARKHQDQKQTSKSQYIIQGGKRNSRQEPGGRWLRQGPRSAVYWLAQPAFL